LRTAPYSSYNLFFIIPFLIWVVIGGFVKFNNEDIPLFTLINQHHNSVSDVLMYYTTQLGDGGVITVMLLVLMLMKPMRNVWYFITATLCTAVAPIISQIIKHKVGADRPLQVLHDAAWIHMEPHWPKLYHNSFPSGHTTGAFCLFCFLSFLLPAGKKWIGLIFFEMAVAVGYSRIYVAAHFYTDVYAGSIIGTVTCVVMFAIMTYFKPRFLQQRTLNNITV
jgi:membrane-associated phospholipid phosphatase